MASYKYDIASGAEAFTFNSVMRACTKEVAALSWCMQHGLIAAKAVCSKCAPPPLHEKEGHALALLEVELQGGEERAHELVRRALHCPDLQAGHGYFLLGERHSRHGGRPTRRGDGKNRWAVGGDGNVVEIDATSMTKKQKYNRGKKHADY
ncbi:hypothetical protein PF005_g30559 [Phytophthora fragariae]|uniref:Uncharacterized protein n=1 Tax=Phytophthora fragariae TaxID=53985 RepID=A0A6A4B4C4_9STRA|nr:hypothetical protein PF003_g16508 [Phytophthora fragariae]KAE8929230.1 hypothetical protein PF009_g20649 [Phytophthora fragariae]KAE9060451.1 hypothetical protein PF007_g30606 [Phytophthora fragariae]KAE9063481.1 hypothetical protein PF006_g30936 [Phytophthora fragariae]KAE9163157.1 hypothetical protein PF005_g30559 [Phytophthora fragariae]